MNVIYPWVLRLLGITSGDSARGGTMGNARKVQERGLEERVFAIAKANMQIVDYKLLLLQLRPAFSLPHPLPPFTITPWVPLVI